MKLLAGVVMTKGLTFSSQQRRNVVAGQRAVGRCPSDSPNAIEPQQAEFRAQPEITIRCLCDGVNEALGEAVAHPPCGMRILVDVERVVQCERACAVPQHHCQTDNRVCVPFFPQRGHFFAQPASYLAEGIAYSLRQARDPDASYFSIAGQLRTTE